MQITLDEGYQFGLGVFETIAIEKGVPLLLSWHLERMNRSLKMLGIDQTVEEEEVTRYLENIHESQNDLPANFSAGQIHHQALKIMVSKENKIFTLRPNHYKPEDYLQGFRLAFSPVYRNETSPLVCHKTMNYGDCILEKRRAASLGADELIFKNSQGQLCEGTISNIFFVREGQIYTPPISCGLLPGVLRRFVLEHFPVTEQVLYEKDIQDMEECFVTNSLMGIMPVHALGEKKFASHQVTKACMHMYKTTLSV